jgi:hypothetical protein
MWQSPSLLLTLNLLVFASCSHAVDPLAAFAPGARILFQGDSITDGNRGRSADPNHILGHGYAFIIAAKFGSAMAASDLTFINRGIKATPCSTWRSAGRKTHSI